MTEQARNALTAILRKHEIALDGSRVIAAADVPAIVDEIFGKLSVSTWHNCQTEPPECGRIVRAINQDDERDASVARGIVKEDWYGLDGEDLSRWMWRKDSEGLPRLLRADKWEA
jgi:hypothetical protein